MILVDTALARREAEGRPVQVALVGAGFMGRGFTNQVANSTPGMRIAVIVNRHVDKAERAYREAGVEDVRRVTTPAALADAIADAAGAVTDDFSIATGTTAIDAIVEATGAVEHGCRVVVDAIEHRKHVVLMNAEVDGTVGPILARRAAEAGVVYTGCAGDQPGVTGDLLRFVAGLGLTPLVAGNIKGLQDEHRTPTTQAGFAAQWGQDPHMVTSFADGTKISFEQATVANASGMTVERRGMRATHHRGHIDELTSAYDVDELRRLGGVVDYVVGSRPGPGVFVFATHDDPKQQHYLNLYKLGEGPLYSFYTPYHLCHFEVPTSVARAVIFEDATLVPVGGPRVEVLTVAKRDLPAGSVLDGLGGYDTYGVAERAEMAAVGDLLPIGVAEGCRLRRDVPKDGTIAYADVELPEGRLVDALRREQAAVFPTLAG